MRANVKRDVDVLAGLRREHVDLSQLNARIPRDLMKRLRLAAVEHDVSVQALVAEAARRLLAQIDGTTARAA